MTLHWEILFEFSTWTHCTCILQGLGKTVSMIALIQMQRSLQSKSKSDDLCHKTEALNLDEDDDNGSGGVDKAKEAVNLDDDDDDNGVDKVKKSEEFDDLKVSSSTREFRRQRPAAGTLVVCPASVLRQWARELDE